MEIICEGTTGKIQCSPRRIVIHGAQYGRDKGCVCECSKCHNLSFECNAPETERKVKSLCRNKKVCHLEAQNIVFGNPCEGIRKRLAVVYSCRDNRHHKE